MPLRSEVQTIFLVHLSHLPNVHATADRIVIELVRVADSRYLGTGDVREGVEIQAVYASNHKIGDAKTEQDR